MQAPQSSTALYAAREPVFPRSVSGRFRSLKWGLMVVLLGIYYLVPWIRWDRGPNLPDQAVLVDLAGRRFFFFGIEIWPHEFHFVAGLLVMAGLGLFLFTSALGRVWCGFACPQTVWTDLFTAVERRIEGDRNAQIRLHRAPLDARKLRLRLAKYAVWLVIAVGTGGAWVFYFADAPTLAGDLFTGQASATAYAAVAILTATTFTFGGFAREQICIYACPWPRIQGAMMDEDTLAVGYRDWRGEPRGKPRDPAAGDCVACNACVSVCPMGIDIRDGQQLACIGCGLCIDACDDVMDRLGRDRGLVGFFALSDATAESAGSAPRPAWAHLVRPRTVLYTALWSLVGIGLVALLLGRPEIDATIAAMRNPTHVLLSDGAVRNTYEVRVRNRGGMDRIFTFSAPDSPVTLSVEAAANSRARVPANETGLVKVHAVAPPGSTFSRAERSPLEIVISESEGGAQRNLETYFTGNR